jgi:PAS domain S-box-containing protein
VPIKFLQISDRSRLFVLAFAMGTITVASTILSTWFFYQAAFDEQKIWLMEIAKSQAQITERIAKYSLKTHPGPHIEGNEDQALSHVLNVFHSFKGLGPTGEFLLAKKDGEMIVFLYQNNVRGFGKPRPVSVHSGLAEPMRRALNGQSGNMVGPDYRGITVLAAYEPVSGLNYGVVAKKDLAKIRAPFVQTAFLSALAAVVLVFIGAFFIHRLGFPILEHLEHTISSLGRAQQIARLGNWERNLITGEQSWSKETFHILGIPEDKKASLLAFKKAVYPDDMGKIRRAISAALKGIDPFDVEYRVVHSGGGARYIHSLAEIVRSPNQTPIGIRGTIQDITDLKEAQNKIIRLNEGLEQRVKDRTLALSEALEQAREASQAKTRFLANMSHELRPPLNAILGFSSVILNETFGTLDNKRYADYIIDIHDSGVLLLELINDILDLSSIEADKLSLSEEVLDPFKTIEDSLKFVEDQSNKKHISLTFNAAEEQTFLLADERRLKQILLNLLTNAVKFNDEGGSVTLSAGFDEGAFYFTVKDTGIGMDKEGLTRALSPFERVEDIFSRTYEGTGLGLPLAKGLAEAHEGTMQVDSALGSGTTITVRFPKERSVVHPEALNI